jgi:cell wall-associated NlpC family hydrolase/SLT domain-containing protein
MANESATAGSGQLLGWNAAQSAISTLTHNINDFNKALTAATSALGGVSKSTKQQSSGGHGNTSFASALWNGSSNYGHGSPIGGGAQFTNTGSQGGGATNNGGRGGTTSGSGGSGGSQGGGGSNNGGHGGKTYGLKDTSQAVINWGQKKLPDQVQMQTTAYQAAQSSTQSWNTLRNQAFKNNFTAQSTTDAGLAYGTLAQSSGWSAGSSQFNSGWNYVTGTSGYTNPGMSQQARAQGVTALGSASAYNTMQSFGIQTIKGGKTQTPRQIATQLMNAMPGLKQVKTKADVAGTLDNQNSQFNKNLRSWGLDQNTQDLVKGEVKNMTLAQANGSSAAAYTSTANKLDSGTSSQISSAKDQLGKWGIGGTSAQTLETRSGTLRNQDVATNDSFTAGLDAATSALDKFSTALTGVLSATGLNSALGFGGGAGALIGGSLSSGLGAYAAGRGIAGAAGVLGRAGGAGGGAGALGGAVSLSRGALGKAGAFGLGAVAANSLGKAATSHIKDTGARAGANVLVDAGTGALTGAAVGSVVPVIGTGIGAAIGGLIGAGVGAYSAAQGDGNPGGASAASGGSGGTSSGSSSASPATGTQGAGKTAAAVIAIAMKYLGTPYKWGGSSPASGFDCSGLLQYSFKQIGVSIPRTSQEQQKIGTQVKLTEVRAGDLMFVGRPAHHVVMCLGNGKCIEAPHTGANVRVRTYSLGEFTSATRIVGSVGSTSAAVSTDSTAGSSSNQLSSMGGFGGDVGSYGSTEEVDAIAAGVTATQSGAIGSGVGASQATASASSTTAPTGAAPTGSLKTWIKSALGILKQDTKANESYVNTIAMHESGGNPKAVNRTDSNAKAGHPSEGIMQTIQSTFDAHSMSGHKDIWNPVDNIIAGVRYAEGRYGSLANAPGIKSLANGGAYVGYAVGSTNIPVDQTAQIHKGEMIIPAYQADAVRKALAGNTPLAGGLPGSKSATSPTLNFHSGAITVQVQGTMDQQSARDAAKQIMQAIAEDNRINTIAAG